MPKGQKFKTLCPKPASVCEACNKQFVATNKRFLNKMLKLHNDAHHKNDEVVNIPLGDMRRRVESQNMPNVLQSIIDNKDKLNITSIKKL